MSIRDDFSFFKQNITYLDNGATTQKPDFVVEKELNYYRTYCSNTHRSSHSFGNQATKEFEETREVVRSFINAKTSKEIVFTKGTTESINLIASSFVKNVFNKVIITPLEHHSNIVPWHLNGFSDDNLIVLEIDQDLKIDLKKYHECMKNNPNSFVSLIYVSNSFGIVNPIKEMIKIAHKYGCVVLIDGAQSVAHIKTDVLDLNADFFVFSAHKLYGPTGVGILYAKYEFLERMRPYQGGGAMISDVNFHNTSFLDPPLKFEAGTQNIAGVIAFVESLKYVQNIGFEKISQIENELLLLLKNELNDIKDLIFYTQKNEAPIVSFNIKNIHHNDIGVLLDKQKILLRVGHHCTLPAMKELKIDGTIRVSLAVYNTKEDIEKFIVALKKAINILKS